MRTHTNTYDTWVLKEKFSEDYCALWTRQAVGMRKENKALQRIAIPDSGMSRSSRKHHELLRLRPHPTRVMWLVPNKSIEPKRDLDGEFLIKERHPHGNADAIRRESSEVRARDKIVGDHDRSTGELPKRRMGMGKGNQPLHKVHLGGHATNPEIAAKGAYAQTTRQRRYDRTSGPRGTRQLCGARLRCWKTLPKKVPHEGLSWVIEHQHRADDAETFMRLRAECRTGRTEGDSERDEQATDSRERWRLFARNIPPSPLFKERNLFHREA